MIEDPTQFAESMAGLFVLIGIVSTVLVIGELIARAMARWSRRKNYVPPPDPSTKRGAQLADEQARYIRRTERQ